MLTAVQPKTSLSLVNGALTAYCESITSLEPPACKRIQQAVTGHPKSHWICGPLVGTLLKTLVLMLRAKNVLDIGTFYGYSAAYMSSASPDLKVISLEVNPEYATEARQLLSSDTSTQNILIEVTDAHIWLLKARTESIDLVFFDSNRDDLMRLYPLLTQVLRPGGVLVMDNALMRGHVLSPVRPWHHASVEFNSTIQANQDFVTTLLPIRDGVLLAYKLDTDYDKQ